MESTIRVSFILLILLFCFNCSNKRAGSEHITTGKDTTILSDPFRTYTSDIYTTINENDIYQEVRFNGFFANVKPDSMYYENVDDPVVFVQSGFNGLNSLLQIQRRIILPTGGKRLDIDILAEYFSYEGKDTAGEDISGENMTMEVLFLKGNTIVGKHTEIIPPTMQLEKSSQSYVNGNTLPERSYRFRIPRGTDNLRATLYTYDKQVIDSLCAGDKISNSDLFSATGLVALYLNKFGFKVDGKPLETYVYDHSIPFEEKEITTLSSQISDQLELDDSIRIIGIGESIHGSGTFYRQTKKIVKELVDRGFTTIGLELPITDGMLLNDYVHGTGDNIDTLLHNREVSFYANTEMKEMFDFLRLYNRDNHTTISVFGFDVPRKDEVNKLKRLVEKEKNDAGGIFGSYLQDYYQEYANYYSEQPPFFKTLLSRQRNKIMNRNICYVDSLFSSGQKMILIAHLGHLYKRGAPDPLPAGHYLSEKYGREYGVIGLFAGDGDFFSGNHEGFSNEKIIKEFPLSKPMGKSLEQLGNALGKESFYLNNASNIELLDKVLYTRYLGAGYSPMQFEPAEIRKEMDYMV